MSSDWNAEFDKRRTARLRAERDDADSARAAASDHARRHRTEMDFVARVEDEIVRPFLRAARSAAGRSAAQPFADGNLWQRTFASQWIIQIDGTDSLPFFGAILEQLTVRSSGQWIMERLVYHGGDRARGASPYDAVLSFGRRDSELFTWIRSDPRDAPVHISPEAAAEIFTKINDAVLDYMVEHDIRPR